MDINIYEQHEKHVQQLKKEENYNKLLEFVKTMANEENSILGMKDFYVPYARKVLKEIGEL